MNSRSKKKALNLLWNEFIFGGHLLSIGPLMLVYICSVLFSFPPSLPIVILLYLITYVVYMFDRYLGIRSDSDSARVGHLNSYKKFIPSIISGCLLIMAFLLLDANWISVAFTVAVVLLGCAYSLFCKDFTKYFTGFKSFYVALIYGSVVLYIVAYHGRPIDMISISLFVFISLRWFSDTVFCDMKDREKDIMDGLRTFPAVMSDSGIHRLLILINLVSVLPILYLVFGLHQPRIILLLLLAVPYAIIYQSMARIRGSNINVLCNVWADGEPILWAGLIFLGRQLQLA